MLKANNLSGAGEGDSIYFIYRTPTATNQSSSSRFEATGVPGFTSQPKQECPHEREAGTAEEGKHEPARGLSAPRPTAWSEHDITRLAFHRWNQRRVQMSDDAANRDQLLWVLRLYSYGVEQGNARYYYRAK